MKKCKSCQSDIEDKAKKCPHCQTDQRIWFAKHPMLTAILVLIIFGVIGSSGENKDTIPTGTTTTQPTSSESVSTSEVLEKTVTNAPSTPIATTTSKQSNVPTEYKSALNKATTYANTMNMSKKGVYDQLVSSYGEKFTPEAAQYAIDNVKADWNANALAKAKTYQDTMNMSPASIRSQLTSAYGEKFTEAEASYAIEHLND